VWVWAAMVVQTERAGVAPLLAQSVEHSVHALALPDPDDPPELLVVEEEVAQGFRHFVSRSEEYPHRKHEREILDPEAPELSDKLPLRLQIVGHLTAS